MLSDLSKTDSYNIGNLKNRVSEKHFLAAAKVNFMCHFRLQYLKYLVYMSGWYMKLIDCT